MSHRSLSRKTLEIIVVVAVFFAYGIGPLLAVEIEHHHDDGHHHHAGQAHSHEVPGHPHTAHASEACRDTGKSCTHDATDDCPDGSTHSHLICCGAIGPAIHWSGLFRVILPSATKAPRTDFNVPCPGEVSFEVLRPPQLA